MTIFNIHEVFLLNSRDLIVIIGTITAGELKDGMFLSTGEMIRSVENVRSANKNAVALTIVHEDKNQLEKVKTLEGTIITITSLFHAP